MVELGDLVPLARSETPVETSLPVLVERRRKINNVEEIGGQAAVKVLTTSGSGLMSGRGAAGRGGGISGSALANAASAAAAAALAQALGSNGDAMNTFVEGRPQMLETWESPWVKAGSVDTELGVVKVEAKVEVDVLSTVGIESRAPSGWLDSGGMNLVGRGEGKVVLWTRVRFETEGERRKETWIAIITGLVSIAALYAVRWWTRQLRGLPAKD